MSITKEKHLQKLLDEERANQWLVLANEYDTLVRTFQRKHDNAMRMYHEYNKKEASDDK